MLRCGDIHYGPKFSIQLEFNDILKAIVERIGNRYHCPLTFLCIM